MGQYDGPYRHIHLACRERKGGFEVTVVTFEIHSGKRRLVKRYPPLTIPAEHRPHSSAGMLMYVAQKLIEGRP